MLLVVLGALPPTPSADIGLTLLLLPLPLQLPSGLPVGCNDIGRVLVAVIPPLLPKNAGVSRALVLSLLPLLPPAPPYLLLPDGGLVTGEKEVKDADLGNVCQGRSPAPAAIRW